jgi:hypothetical protein
MVSSRAMAIVSATISAGALEGNYRFVVGHKHSPKKLIFSKRQKILGVFAKGFGKSQARCRSTLQ